MQVRMSYHYKNFKPGDVVDLPADEALSLIASFRAVDASAVPSLTVDGVFRGTVNTGPPPAAPGSWQPGDWMTARDGSGLWTLDGARRWTSAGGSLPAVGAYTYDGAGNVLTDPDGNSYTWNPDGTVDTQSRGGTTRTFHWNADGTLASVS